MDQGDRDLKVREGEPTAQFDGSQSVARWDDGVATIFSPELLRPDLGRFCRALASEVAEIPGVSRATVCSASAVWRIEFTSPEVDPAEVALALVRTVERALHALDLDTDLGDALSIWFAFPRPDGPASVWQAAPLSPGCFRIRSTALQGRPFLSSRLAASMSLGAGIESCRASWLHGSIDVQMDGSIASLVDLVASTERLLREFQERDDPAGPIASLLPPFNRSFRTGRTRDLLLAGGSIAMVVTGVLLPGLPAAPFLLCAAYFAARGWPALGNALRAFPSIRSVLDRPLALPRPRELVGMAGLATASVVVLLVLRPPLPLVLLLEAGAVGASAARWTRQAEEQKPGMSLTALPAT